MNSLQPRLFPWFDPLAPAGRLRPMIWGVLCLLVLFLQGPRFISTLPGNLQEGGDFFQDWASARDWLEGRSPYEKLSDSLERLMGIPVASEGKPGASMDITVNAHPPFSLLVILPFALLPYEQALLAWNMVMLGIFFGSLWVCWRLLELPWCSWSILPAVTVFLLCGPVQSQIIQGQWNFLLLALLVGTWWAIRREQQLLAGCLIGLATAIKFTPAFFLLYFLLQRQWKALLWALITFALSMLVMLALLGTQTWFDYFQRVLPIVKGFEGSWVNISLHGFFGKLFFPEYPGLLPPLSDSAFLGKLLSLVARAGLLAMYVLLNLIRWPASRERMFHFGLVVMLLVAPISWDHYLLQAIPALLLCWKDLRQHPMLKVFFLIEVVLFCVYMGDLQYKIKHGWNLTSVTGPLYSITVLSIPTYALLLMLALLAHPIFRAPEVPATPDSKRSLPLI